MKYFSIIMIGITLISCNHHEANETGTVKPASVNVDSLERLFLDGWNNRDSAAIMNTIAGNGIVMNDSLIHTGTKEIADKWISGGVKVLSNIKTTAAIREGDGQIAYSGGTYSLDLTPPGGPLLREKGNYSFVWSKQSSGEWKLTLIHIEDITRMPDIK
ncbi:MAG: nuclear transport factor 2 family protein [Chitinophagaceae bacterium]|nr:nuclear transport factor 2 family protein [Chitinophagaceae bacterium]